LFKKLNKLRQTRVLGCPSEPECRYFTPNLPRPGGRAAPWDVAEHLKTEIGNRACRVASSLTSGPLRYLNAFIFAHPRFAVLERSDS
jgi:hypothetical protein